MEGEEINIFENIKQLVSQTINNTYSVPGPAPNTVESEVNLRHTLLYT